MQVKCSLYNYSFNRRCMPPPPSTPPRPPLQRPSLPPSSCSSRTDELCREAASKLSSYYRDTQPASPPSGSTRSQLFSAPAAKPRLLPRLRSARAEDGHSALTNRAEPPCSPLPRARGRALRRAPCRDRSL